MNIDRNLRSRMLMTLPLAALAISLAACAGAGGEDQQTPQEAKDLVTATMQEAVTTCGTTE